MTVFQKKEKAKIIWNDFFNIILITIAKYLELIISLRLCLLNWSGLSLSLKKLRKRCKFEKIHGKHGKVSKNCLSVINEKVADFSFGGPSYFSVKFFFRKGQTLLSYTYNLKFYHQYNENFFNKFWSEPYCCLLFTVVYCLLLLIVYCCLLFTVVYCLLLFIVYCLSVIICLLLCRCLMIVLNLAYLHGSIQVFMQHILLNQLTTNFSHHIETI